MSVILCSSSACLTSFFNIAIYTGSFGIIWFIFWLVLGFGSPATHPRISAAERRYIETSLQEVKVEQVR